MTKNTYLRYIAVQTVIMLVVLITLISFFMFYQHSENNHQLTNIGQTVAYSMQQHILRTEGVLTSLAYNYEIDSDIDIERFKILAERYISEVPDILLIQHKNKETVTDMVFPPEYDNTMGLSLKDRDEVEEAVNKSIQNRIITANDPYILKNADNTLGLVIRCPLYKGDEFDGFFVVVFDLNSCIDRLVSEALPSSCRLSLYDSKGRMFWSNSDTQLKNPYVTQIPVMDSFWTMQLSKMETHMKVSEILMVIISVLFLLVTGFLAYVQVDLFKKNKNIKSLMKLRNELERVKESYTLALDSANDALWEWDLITDEVITSDKWVDITGNEPVGSGFKSIFNENAIHPDDYQRILNIFERCLDGTTDEFYGEYRIKDEFGNYTWVQNKGKVYFDDEDIPDKVAGAVSNIEERKQKESKIEYLAFYDILTGLPNKIQFLNILEKTLKYIEKSSNLYSILMLDLDNFKVHNDLFGLEFCDHLLEHIGVRLSETVGQENMVARFGGDEFLILIADENGISGVEDICEGIMDIFASPFVIMKKSVYLTASIGVVYKLESSQSANEIIRNADTALNKAKERGKNQYCFYDSLMHEEILRKSKVEACIREALMNDSFIIHYQPQQDLLSGKIRGIEALARLESEELGMIPPIEFIAIAEYTGLIIPLGNWMLKNACVQGKAWIDRGFRIGKLSVNISINQLRDVNFCNILKEILLDTEFPVNQLELEITESVLWNSSKDNIEILKKLKQFGISIALDDFGTGYSSLNYLTILPIDILKIDKSFVDKAIKRETEHRVIGSIIELAHNLHMKVVSEGVETAGQKLVLEEMKCDYIQGYYFARPGDAKSVEKWFEMQ